MRRPPPAARVGRTAGVLVGPALMGLEIGERSYYLCTTDADGEANRGISRYVEYCAVNTF